MSIRGILPATAIANEIPVDLRAFVQSTYINEYPLVTRLSRLPIGTNEFSIITSGPRPRVFTLGAAITTAGATTVTFSDVRSLLQGDVFAVGAERIEVNGTITITNASTGAGTVVVVRAVEGTTATDSTASAGTHGNGSTIRLVGNSRRGNEVDQESYRTTRAFTKQFIQTFQFPIQVGGRAAALTQAVTPMPVGPSRTPMGGPQLTREENDKLRDMMKDEEETSLYGLGEDGATAVTGRWKQKGLRTFASLAGNLTTSPTNAGAYKPVDLERDIVQKLADRGGFCDIILASTNFGLGMSTWGQAHVAIAAGTTELGAPIEVLRPSLFPSLAIWYTRGLRPFTAVGLDSSRVRMRAIRNESYQARGKRGDAFEGDWLSDMGIEIEDPEQAVAWVEGITNFAPASGMA